MQDSGSLAVFKVTTRDQGHYEGPSEAFVTYCNISCIYLKLFFMWKFTLQKYGTPSDIYILLSITETYKIIFAYFRIFIMMVNIR